MWHMNSGMRDSATMMLCEIVTAASCYTVTFVLVRFRIPAAMEFKAIVAIISTKILIVFTFRTTTG